MNSSKYLWLIITMISLLVSNAQSPNSWRKISNFSGGVRELGISFNIDSLGYVGLGEMVDTFPLPPMYPNDFWEYNPLTNTWTQKASFPAPGRIFSAYFAIGKKAYVGLGYGTGAVVSHFWEYDQLSDTWSQKADFPGGSREPSLFFSVGGKGYVGMGSVDTAVNRYPKDIWEYDPLADSWTRKNDFPGQGVSEYFLFSINSYAYVGFGYDLQLNNLMDFWRYNPANDSWMQLSNFNIHSIVDLSFSFNIKNKGYIAFVDDTVGIYKRYFWQFNDNSDTWIPKDSFPGTATNSLSSFVIGNRAYVGIGTSNNLPDCVSDFWMYTPDSITTGITDIQSSSLTVSFHPNPVEDAGMLNIIASQNTKAKIEIIDLLGREISTVYYGEITAGTMSLAVDTKSLSVGIYLLNIKLDGEQKTLKFLKYNH